MACNNENPCGNPCGGAQSNNSGYLIILVLYILIAILLSSWFIY